MRNRKLLKLMLAYPEFIGLALGKLLMKVNDVLRCTLAVRDSWGELGSKDGLFSTPATATVHPPPRMSPAPFWGSSLISLREKHRTRCLTGFCVAASQYASKVKKVRCLGILRRSRGRAKGPEDTKQNARATHFSFGKLQTP